MRALEQKLTALSSQMMEEDDSHRRNQLESELRAVGTALAHYRRAFDIEMVSIDGRLTSDVKFGGGLLGHLQKGGEVKVKRTEIAPDHWELTEMTVNMQGKALLFKTISVQQKEVHTDFQSVGDLSFSEAAALLLQEALVAVKR